MYIVEYRDGDPQIMKYLTLFSSMIWLICVSLFSLLFMNMFMCVCVFANLSSELVYRAKCSQPLLFSRSIHFCQSLFSPSRSSHTAHNTVTHIIKNPHKSQHPQSLSPSQFIKYTHKELKTLLYIRALNQGPRPRLQLRHHGLWSLQNCIEIAIAAASTTFVYNFS